MDKKKHAAAKAGIGYTVGNYLIKGIGFITVPLFARLMSAEDFGIYNTFLAYEAILYLFINLAIHMSLRNAKYKFKNQLDKFTASITIIPFIMMVIMLIIVRTFTKQLMEVFDLDALSLYLVVIYSFCSGVVYIYQQRISLDYFYKEYIGMSLFNVFCNVGVSVILIITVCSSQRYMGRIIGGTAAYIMLTLYILVRIYRRAKPIINLKYWRYALKLGLPLIPHGLAQIVLLQFDRIMINKMVGAMEAGIYSFAYTIYSLVQITATSLSTVYMPWVYEKLYNNETKEIKKIGTEFMLLLAGATTVVLLMSPEVIIILGGKQYVDAVDCSFPVMLGGFFAMLYNVPSVIEYYYEKNQYITIGTSAAAIFNVILNYIFIQKYGYIAAAYTTLACYVLYSVMHILIARKLSGFFCIKNTYLVTAIAIILIAFTVGMEFKQFIVVRLITALVLCAVGIVLIIRVYGKEDITNLICEMKNKREKE